MKKILALILSLLLTLSMFALMTACDSGSAGDSSGETSGNASGNNSTGNNTGNNSGNNSTPVVEGTPYDGGYFTATLPKTLTLITDQGNTKMYMDVVNGITLNIIAGTAQPDENGEPDYSWADITDPEVLKNYYETTINSANEVSDISSKVISDKHQYEITYKTHSSITETDTYYTIYIIASDPDSSGVIQITQFAITEKSADRPIAKSILGSL